MAGANNTGGRTYAGDRFNVRDARTRRQLNLVRERVANHDRILGRLGGTYKPQARIGGTASSVDIKSVWIDGIDGATGHTQFTVRDLPTDDAGTAYNVRAMSYPPDGSGQVGTHDLRDCYPVRMPGYPLLIFYGPVFDGVETVTDWWCVDTFELRHTWGG